MALAKALDVAVFSLSKFYISDVNHTSVVFQFIFFFQYETPWITEALANVDVLKTTEPLNV